MAVRIEVLSANRSEAHVALYYVIPEVSRLAAAVDANRVALGTRLSAQELQDLKDGVLFEVDRTVSVVGMTNGQARTRLQNLWTEMESAALAEYTARYRHAHVAWDGTNWR